MYINRGESKGLFGRMGEKGCGGRGSKETDRHRQKQLDSQKPVVTERNVRGMEYLNAVT